MTISKIVRMFENNNVIVCGMKGTGKDVLFGNVIARRQKPYVSNLMYCEKFHNELDYKVMCMNGNTYKDLINGTVKFYEYPYPLGSDIYISDAGVYLPSQYCNELNKDYKEMPLYYALCRQLSRNAVHCNTQYLGRVWDKLREQADQYIRCRYCYVLFGKLVIQGVTIYDKYESALNRVKPCKVRKPITNDKTAVQMAKQYLDNFYNQHGSVKNGLLIYWNKSQHNTYYFEGVFKNGKK